MIITIIVLLIGGPFSFLHSKEAGCTTMAILGLLLLIMAVHVYIEVMSFPFRG